MSIRIETKRLVLRQFEQNDAERLHELCSQPYILKWMPDWERSIEQRKEWLDWVIKQYNIATKETARIMLAVTLKETGTLLGMVGIGNKEEVDNEIEIAYFVSEEYSGKGYITEAAKVMLQWAFETLGMEYIIAIVETDNYASLRVVEKCGFEKLGTRMILNSGETQEKPFFYYKLYNNRK